MACSRLASVLAPGTALERLGRPMTFSVHGLPVARGIAIGRAVLMASSRVDVAHYFIEPDQIETEIARVRVGRNAVVDEIHRLQQTSRDGPEGGAARAGRPARRAPDAAAGRGADQRRQALDHRAPLQRRMGADDAARGAGAPVRRDGGRVPARAQGRPRAGGRAHPALHEGPAAVLAPRRRGARAAAPTATQQDLLLADDSSTCRWC